MNRHTVDQKVSNINRALNTSTGLFVGSGIAHGASMLASGARRLKLAKLGRYTSWAALGLGTAASIYQLSAEFGRGVTPKQRAAINRRTAGASLGNLAGFLAGPQLGAVATIAGVKGADKLLGFLAAKARPLVDKGIDAARFARARGVNEAGKTAASNTSRVFFRRIRGRIIPIRATNAAYGGGRLLPFKK